MLNPIPGGSPGPGLLARGSHRSDHSKAGPGRQWLWIWEATGGVDMGRGGRLLVSNFQVGSVHIPHSPPSCPPALLAPPLASLTALPLYSPLAILHHFPSLLPCHSTPPVILPFPSSPCYPLPLPCHSTPSCCPSPLPPPCCPPRLLFPTALLQLP